MPTISGNVGAVFNGGTITAPLSIDTAVATVPLSIQAAAGAAADGDTLVQVAGDVANAALTAEAGGGFGASANTTFSAGHTLSLDGADILQLRAALSSLNAPAGGTVQLSAGGTTKVSANATGVGFYAGAPAGKPVVTGAKGGNAALTSLLVGLESLGLITDSTT